MRSLVVGIYLYDTTINIVEKCIQPTILNVTKENCLNYYKLKQRFGQRGTGKGLQLTELERSRPAVGNEIHVLDKSSQDEMNGKHIKRAGSNNR